MSEFRLTQISDTHLGRRFPGLIANFQAISEHIDGNRPDLVINTGDVAFDGPTGRDDVVFAKDLHEALPVACRYLPGNHDIGDNPTAVGPGPKPPVTEAHRRQFCDLIGEDHWSFEAAGWRFIGLNSLVMNSGLAFEVEQFDWLSQQIARTNGRPVALFLHKPVFLNLPDDPETPETAIRYVPQPARARLIEMLGTIDLRLIASGHVHQRRDFTWRHTRHVWAPSAGFVINDQRQDRIAIKEVGLVEYRFRPDGFEVRHVRAAGQVDVDIEELLVQMGGEH
ncbi:MULTISPECIES: metallophosphoesterase family protein [Bradyrhizobium]|uniref:Metallophosphoesterase n=1 Tax=Bradyrhizobium ottawaense TaxID=931866 RepID=A0A2U8PMB1_9BRAD|nr:MULTISPECIES: metallophosphoesterase [Bradyrhizobium]AWL98427.1 metallophosphoesterase [Bradyrhizobium ottawaense]MBR1326300.1 metallophosphoesterase [Bradyrhizobium ottawaense]MBR1332064.1 metallophosphoesterase [Bradyrhizobium ottawaense]MDA9452405.1 phosphohydrolase [Bradyrhizobium sp. CCBAU 21360]MDA9452980.1 phosphohydrolase [Bradyrhizobium sp. CCBAU 21359]